ncbi:MAG: DUF2933 domain-containing protein [Mesorhizobium sp.]|nr:DUF2933 domain-containing protein [Mesorhizobium sp.]TIS89713.1 MAG: DUF2933 domain-containing protein [Mesorhizobium sp.]TJW35356.1 MAG: DUF2933 domain-containing protein [Mesorhizobium sp.]
MSMQNHSNQEHPQGSFLTSRAGLVLLGFLVIGGFLLFTEHRAHVLGALFYLLPFACIFMHLFMHGGHGHGGHGGHRHQPDERNPS